MRILSFIHGVRLSLVSLALLGCSVRAPDSMHRAMQPRELTAQGWMALSQPGAAHKELERLVGEWRVSISLRSAPSQAPTVSAGRSKITWTLDNRFVEEEFIGELGGQRYQGRGFLGFDNATRRYVNVWFESLSTGATVTYGTYDSDKALFRFQGPVYDPALGRTKKVRIELQVNSADEFRLSFIERADSGVDFAAFESIYRRQLPATASSKEG